MNTYAYGRVSAKDQNLQRQLSAFIEFGIETEYVYTDKKSGNNGEYIADTEQNSTLFLGCSDFSPMVSPSRHTKKGAFLSPQIVCLFLYFLAFYIPTSLFILFVQYHTFLFGN